MIPITLHSHDDTAYSNLSLLVREQVYSKADQPSIVLGQPTLALLLNLFRNESPAILLLVFSFFINSKQSDSGPFMLSAGVIKLSIQAVIE